MNADLPTGRHAPYGGHVLHTALKFSILPTNCRPSIDHPANWDGKEALGDFIVSVARQQPRGRASGRRCSSYAICCRKAAVLCTRIVFIANAGASCAGSADNLVVAIQLCELCIGWQVVIRQYCLAEDICKLVLKGCQ